MDSLLLCGLGAVRLGCLQARRIQNHTYGLLNVSHHVFGGIFVWQELPLLFRFCKFKLPVKLRRPSSTVVVRNALLQHPIASCPCLGVVMVQGQPPESGLPAPWMLLSSPERILVPKCFAALPPRGHRHIVVHAACLDRDQKKSTCFTSFERFDFSCCLHFHSDIHSQVPFCLLALDSHSLQKPHHRCARCCENLCLTCGNDFQGIRFRVFRCTCVCEVAQCCVFELKQLCSTASWPCVVFALWTALGEAVAQDMYEICSNFLPAIQRVGKSAENTFELTQQIRTNPSVLVSDITAELSECISALDSRLLSNMLLFVATEFIEQIDGAEDWALGFGVLPCCS